MNESLRTVMGRGLAAIASRGLNKKVTYRLGYLIIGGKRYKLTEKLREEILEKADYFYEEKLNAKTKSKVKFS